MATLVSDSAAGRPTRCVVSVVVVVVLIVAAQNVGAQDPPIEPTPTPVPQDEPQDPVPPESTESSEEQESEGSEDDWREDEGPAHTAHGPFDVESIEAEPFTLKWGNFVGGVRGLSRYSLFDGQVKFRLGVKIQADGTVATENTKFLENYSPIEATADLRRLRLYAAGIFRNMDFLVGFDLGSDWGLKDAWVEGRHGGLEVWGHYLGRLRLGQMREPFSLERQTSSSNTGFLERSLPVQTFAPGHNIGVMVHGAGSRGRTTWAFGGFSFGKKNDDNASTSALSLTTRWTWLPSYRNEGRHLIHFGGSFSTRNPLGDDTRYRSRPEARFVDYLVDTGEIETSRTTLIGLEFAMVRGPLWVQAEYIQADLSAQLLGDPRFMGTYGQVGWFITGDVRPYRKNSGIFDRVRPETKYKGAKPFKKMGGGAWELVGRYSRVDLTDQEVEGGVLTDVSGALNWYLNPTTRIQLNYIHASPEGRGAANIFVLRFQYIPW